MRSYLGTSFLILVVALVGVFCTLGFEHICGAFGKNPHLFIDDPTNTASGYILVSEYALVDKNANTGRVELLDKNGNVVHRWTTKYTPLEARLEQNGNLIVSMTPPADSSTFPALGTTGLMQELDWNGKVLWEYSDPLMNHDFELMDDGSIVYSRWSEASSSFADGINGGFRAATSTKVWVNDLVRINKNKEILWQWHMQEHLSPSEYRVSPYIPITDWSHLNSVRYIPNNPLTHVPAYLISLRNVSTVLMIDASSGDVLWRSPPNTMSTQHDATLLDNGDVLIFNNGFLFGGSSISTGLVEINPRTNETVWQYAGGMGGGTLFSTILAGGAQRLANGNTLITLSTQGRILEITPDKRTVWEYWNLYRYDNMQHWVFKAHKYDSTGTLWSAWVHAPFYAAICAPSTYAGN